MRFSGCYRNLYLFRLALLYRIIKGAHLELTSKAPLHPISLTFDAIIQKSTRSDLTEATLNVRRNVAAVPLLIKYIFPKNLKLPTQ